MINNIEQKTLYHLVFCRDLLKNATYCEYFNLTGLSCLLEQTVEQIDDELKRRYPDIMKKFRKIKLNDGSYCETFFKMNLGKETVYPECNAGLLDTDAITDNGCCILQDTAIYKVNYQGYNDDVKDRSVKSLVEEYTIIMEADASGMLGYGDNIWRIDFLYKANKEILDELTHRYPDVMKKFPRHAPALLLPLFKRELGAFFL